MDGQTTPRQPQMANFPNSTGPRRDCGHADVQTLPPGLGNTRPKPSAGVKPQTPSAAAASPVPNLNFSHLSRTGGADGSTQPRRGRNQGHGYESFGEQNNNSQIPPKPQRQRRNGGDFPGHGDDDDEPDEEDDDE
eukprot:1789141-Amphidinium_carterae.2